MIEQYSREMYEALDYFERNIGKLAYTSSLQREVKQQWLKGHYYCNGHVNNLFRAFLMGVNYGQNL